MKICIINGPNLNLLGKREPKIYGSQTFEDYLEILKSKFPKVALTYFQSNIEGELIGKIQEFGFSYDGIIRIWDDIKNDKTFKERYHFIDWDWSCGETLNNSQEFLQIMSIYNLASPLISVLMPIFILTIPFFIITIKGYNLSFS